MKRFKYAITISSASSAMMYLTILAMFGEPNPSCWPNFILGVSLFALAMQFVLTYGNYKS